MKARPSSEFALRSLLIGMMVGALSAALAAAGRAITGESSPFIVIFCALVAIEAQWSHWALTERLPQSFDRHWFRGAELGALVLLGLLGDATLGGRPGGLGSIATLDLRPILIALLILVAWGASTTTASEFARLGEPPERDPTYTPPLEGLTQRFFGGGALLLLAIGLSQIEVRRLLDATRAPVTGPVISALIYFTFGMILLALAQHALLGRRWREEGIAVAAGLGGRWARLSVGFMGLTALLAFILPTAYGVGLLDILALILQGLLALFALFGFGVIGPLIWLLSLIKGGSTTDTPTAPPAAPPPPPPPPAESSGLPWLDILRWTIFGIVALALAFWLLRGWIENRALLREGFGRFRLIAFLGAFFTALLARLRGLATAIGERLPNLRPGRPSTRLVGTGGRRLRLPGARTPREQVIRYYLSLIRRAESQGLPRRAAQTPAEYAADFDARVPEARQDLAALTDSFVEARYSRHEVTPTESERARGSWERVRDALRRWQRQRAAEAAEAGNGIDARRVR
ncbi:MAG TPA: DUF4129 domain-containing protein [Thermomicrobiales bacterium]|jgi:hypothetical protein